MGGGAQRPEPGPEAAPGRGPGPAELALALLGGLAISLSWGLRHLTSNQWDYFLAGLRLTDPGFAPGDWRTWQADHYHALFGHLYRLLEATGQPGPASVALHVLFMAAFCLGVLLVCRSLAARPLPVYLGVVLWVGLSTSSETSLGGHYLVSPYLQPAHISGSLMALGLGLVAARRWLGAGLALGVGGVFHAGMMASLAPVALAAALAGGVWRRRRGLLMLVLPVAALWGGLAAWLWQAGYLSGGEEAARIMALGRIPHHCDPRLWDPRQSLNWALWIAAGGVALRAGLGPGWWRTSAGAGLAAGAALIPALAAVAVGGWSSGLASKHLFFVATWPLVVGLAALSALCWRVAAAERPAGEPWVRAAVVLGALAAGYWSQWPMLAQPGGLAAAAGLGLALAAPLWLTGRKPLVFWAGAALSLAAAGWVLAQGELRPWARALWIAVPALAAAWRRMGSGSAWRLPGARAAGAAVLALAVAGSAAWGWHTLGYRSGLRPDSPERASLERWVRQHTPPGAVFVIPPKYMEFRIRTRRPVVVDWKSASYHPVHAVEWYRRLCAVGGLEPGERGLPRGLQHLATQGYRDLGAKRARRLRRLYGAEYFVISLRGGKRHRGELDGLVLAYQNPAWAVYRLP